MIPRPGERPTGRTAGECRRRTAARRRSRGAVARRASLSVRQHCTLVPHIGPHCSARSFTVPHASPTVPKVRPHRSAGASPQCRRSSQRSGGSSPPFRRFVPTVPHIASHCSAQCVPLFRRFVPAVPNGASYCSVLSSALFRMARLTVPQVRPHCSAQCVPLFRRFVPTVPHGASHCSARAEHRSAPASPSFRTCVRPFRACVAAVRELRYLLLLRALEARTRLGQISTRHVAGALSTSRVTSIRPTEPNPARTSPATVAPSLSSYRRTECPSAWRDRRRRRGRCFRWRKG